ncbi:serine hydrolase domain-containing protein, partial [Paraburkholderia oxyphila]|uniref:serine hydrolase domain-containing protein n=1 Tax=Paraburkholderia oxyphila TaxID=614212 RepID=UPI001FDFC98B
MMEGAGSTGQGGAIDAVFSAFNRSDAPGLVVGVALHGQVLYRRGFGLASLEHGVVNTPATRLRIGSTSKHFTALLALLLAEEGKLDLDASIRTYIPELTGPGGEPSLRQLLQHRGGSRCYLDLGFLFHAMAVPQQGTALATQVRQTGRNFVPGEAMIYNNGGYHLVSIAIERVGGDAFESQLKSRLFDPLRMADTASVPSDYVIVPGIATMHMPAADGGWRRG